jgi:acyl carrier protein
MESAAIRDAVHRYISRLLDGIDEFDDDLSLEQLGLDKQDIEALLFHLEDQFDLTASTHEEDQLLKSAITTNDLCRFLLEISRR